jgi:hypothetical protein
VSLQTLPAQILYEIYEQPSPSVPSRIPLSLTPGIAPLSQPPKAQSPPAAHLGRQGWLHGQLGSAA